MSGNKISTLPMEKLFLIPEDYKFLLDGVVYGQQPSMKNRNRVIWQDGNPVVIHSAEVYEYKKQFKEQAVNKPEWKIGVGSREKQLAIYIAIYYESYRSDPSIDLILDLLQDNGTINNDRWVRQKFYWAGISKTAPRLHFRLYELPLGWEMPNFLLRPTERKANDK